MGETTQKSAETGIVKEFIFGRNEPARTITTILSEKH